MEGGDRGGKGRREREINAYSHIVGSFALYYRVGIGTGTEE